MAETKVKVRLDTNVAKKALRGLTKQAKSTATRVSRDLKGAVTSGFGLGVGFAAGGAALKSATSSGVMDVMGDALGGFGAQLAEFFMGDMDDEARAMKTTRQEIGNAFASTISRQGGVVPPSVQAAFNNLYTPNLHEEIGKGVIDRNEDMRNSSVTKMIDRIATVITDAFKAAAEHLFTLMPFSTSK
jgi:hypothetical protein